MTIGERLREERERLGFNQTDFGEAGRVGRKSQFSYETDKSYPDAQYLADLSEATGADVQYIVTGVRSETALTPDERELLALFRSASLSVKAASVGALRGGGAKISIGGSVTGQIVKGSLVNRGPVNIGNTGRKKK